MRQRRRGPISSLKARWRERHFRFMVLIYGSCVAIVGMFAIPAVLTVSSNPGFCALCHSMNPEYQTWRRSSHAQITCYGCHGPRSYVQLLYGKALVDSKGPLQEATGNFEQPVNEVSHLSQEKIPSERCERCHNNDNRRFTFSEGIYMDHAAHKGAGIDCTVCHNRVVHRGAEQYDPLKSWDPEFRYKDFLTMKDGCFRCHSASPQSRDAETLKKIKNGKTPPGGCSTCHTKDFPLPLGHGTTDWRSQHGPQALKDMGYCMTCHSETGKFSNGDEPWCTLCHDRTTVEGLIGRKWSHE